MKQEDDGSVAEVFATPVIKKGTRDLTTYT